VTLLLAAEMALNLWEDRKGKARAEVMETLLRFTGLEGLLDCLRLYYGGQRISPRMAKHMFCEAAGVWPEVWEVAVKEESFSDVLATESSDSGPSGWSVKQALTMLDDLEQHDLLRICHSMNEVEAFVFWKAAFGEKVLPISELSFVCALGWQSRINVQTVTSAYHMMPVDELVMRIVADPESLPYVHPKPKRGVQACNFRPWGRNILPDEGYVDIVSGKRRFLHVHRDRKGDSVCTLRDRTGAVVPGLPMKWDGVAPEGEWIVEVEENYRLQRVTDCLYHDESVIGLPYEERLAHLEAWKPLMRVTTPSPLTPHDSAQSILTEAKDGEQVRILNGSPYTPGESGGWILLNSIFQFFLLLTHVKRNGDGYAVVRLAAMDGFDPESVCELTLDGLLSTTLFARLTFRERLIEREWEVVENLGVLLEVSCTDIEADTYRFLNPIAASIASDLGRGDTSQFTDIVEASL